MNNILEELYMLKINDYLANRKFIDECDKIASAYNDKLCGSITWSFSEHRLRLRDTYMDKNDCFRNNEVQIVCKGGLANSKFIYPESAQSITAEELKDWLKWYDKEYGLNQHYKCK